MLADSRTKEIKMVWQICNVDDYLKVNRCYKCSKYNHRAIDCQGEDTCSLCVGNHSLSACKASEREFRCVNCITKLDTILNNAKDTGVMFSIDSNSRS